MKHYFVTPEQINDNEDVASTRFEYPYRHIGMSYNPEAGGYAVVPLPLAFNGTMHARVHFNTSGQSGHIMAASVSCDGYPTNNLNNANVVCSADASGTANKIIASALVSLDCRNLSGTTITVKVQPDLEATTENMPVDIVGVELFIGEM